MADMIRNVLAGIGALTVLAVVGVFALVWSAWRHDQRSRTRRLPTPEDLTEAACDRLRADLDAWERGEKP